MRALGRTARFKRDFRREKKTDKRLEETLIRVVELLMSDEKLPDRLKDHALVGGSKGYRDCHIKPDLVLIYQKSEEILTLVRIGSHSEIFD